MNILAVMGSPRPKGNTDILVSTIIEAACAAGARAETLRLGQLEIRECDGCHACWRGKPCTKDDDMRAIYLNIATADVFVFGTPVYWYGPTALMKAFIDRFVYFNCPENRAKVMGKRAAVAIVLEEENEAAWQPVVTFFRKTLAYLEMRLAGTIVVPGVGEKGAIRRHTASLERARRLGAALAVDRP